MFLSSWAHAKDKPPHIVFMKSDVDFTYQASVLQVNDDTVEVVTNSNFLFTLFRKVRIGSWKVNGKEARSFIQAVRRLKMTKIPVAKDNGGHSLRTWMLGEKVILSSHESSGFAAAIESLLSSSEAKLIDGFEFEVTTQTFNQITLKTKPDFECSREEAVCKIGGNMARIYFRPITPAK